MKYFSLIELSNSNTAQLRGIDNTPTSDVKVNLIHLITHLLNPIREKFGKPIKVNSGYRCPSLNKSVGGSVSSQHVKGEAVDITAGNPTLNKQLFTLIQNSGLPFDQLIDEKNYTWLHVSLKSNTNRKQILHL